ncbi:MAG: isoprenylcysteine carboxylmethyltransferase family protein [Cyclobacteriaceae bacterium]|nr:isoprenylcysteine carboxylmethyltransferase family protein [Cyclobacteriaceae bacterium]MDH5250985.1 isoprenylcysteine carboxylmethyltransferase family protein [Cyclobacteriaceae bacterium]
MKEKKDSPGVYFPPPLLYVLTFFLSILVQRFIPLSMAFFNSEIAGIAGKIWIGIAVALVLPALIRFFRTKNTVILIKPANSLQTAGIYSFTRNPMYLGLLILYMGIAFHIGNWWTFMLVPILILIVNRFVIRNEEEYLERAFGKDYLEYKNRVRRWI